jgi:exopolysaccharide biosynthesis polyprenyl glycosylphosphotransferase
MRLRKPHTYFYIILDWLSAATAWALFFSYRKMYIESQLFGIEVAVYLDRKLINGTLLIATYWVVLYALLGTYNDVYRKSRLNEIGLTFLSTLIGTTILFFVLLLDDFVASYQTYYRSVAALFVLYFVITSVFRSIFLTKISGLFGSGRITFNTLMVGGNGLATDLYQRLNAQNKGQVYKFVGFIDPVHTQKSMIEKTLMPRLGTLKNISETIEKYGVEEVIIALDSVEQHKFKELINILRGEKVIIKIIPDMYDIMLGHVKMQQIFGEILIEIYPEIMPTWQVFLKRLIDIVASGVALVVLLPLLVYTVIRVKLSSEGGVFFRQERVGKGGKLFLMTKFRSMYENAEANGPALSTGDADPRITHWGKTMRKFRLDELPQFYHVLMGDMSLVGPRPERQHYINLIAKPHVKILHTVRPGITSWGQVKFGYADTVAQMIERLKFDVLYIENMSLLVDFKIMIYTVLIILQGRGK